jgi:cytochrome P450
MFIFSIIVWIYSNLVIISVSLISYFVVKQIYDEYEAKKKLPKGLKGLPFVGSLPFLGKEPSKALVKLSKQFGPVFGIQLGTTPVLVLNDWPSIKEAFSKDALNGRPEDNVFNSIIPQTSFGISSGSQWREQRRFTLHQLRNLGFGKTLMEDHIIDEINYLTKEIDKTDGNAVDVRKYYSRSVLNNINSLIFGHRLEYDDKDTQMFEEMLEPDPILNSVGILAFFPALSRFIFRYLFFLTPKAFKNLKVLIYKMLNFVKNQISNHEKTLNKDNIRDYIDTFLLEMRHQKNGEKTTFTMDMLEGNILMLFGAGSNTVLTSLEWATLILATHPNVQNKLQQEIDDIIGKERSPKYVDRNRMPYMQAFIWELWRFRSIAPINLPRKTMEETTIQGYKIPKDTFVLANFWALDNDHNLYDDPQDFKPERFLTEDKKQFTKP